MSVTGKSQRLSENPPPVKLNGVQKKEKGDRHITFGTIACPLFLIWAALLFAGDDVDRLEGKVFTLGKAINGNTIELQGGEIVRLIGIKVPAGPDEEEARGFLERSLRDQKFRLEWDEANDPAHHRDAAGRLLAYVFIDTEIPVTRDVSAEEYYEHYPRNGFYSVMINASSVKSGFSQADTESPFKYKDQFLALDRDARAR